MVNCKIIDFFFALFPLKKWQNFLIQHHYLHCQVCQKTLAGENEVKSLLVQKKSLGNMESFWPTLKTKLMQEKPQKQAILLFRWRWIFVSTLVTAFLLAGIWLLKVNVTSQASRPQAAQEHFQINYIRTEGKPADVFLFQPHDSGIIIVWVEKIM